MAAITQHSKIRIKRSTTTGATPTIGTTNDHTDGTWSNTDIYVGEFFYNVVDNRLWIGKLGGAQEISTAQLFELTYAEAELQKTIVGSPSGDGLIIGALYKITDRGDNGLILQAIDIDKFSNYCDELIASPEEHIPAIYDFDADVLTYPSGANYKVYLVNVEQTSTNDPTSVLLDNTIGTITLTRNSQGNYRANSTALFTSGKTTCTLGTGRFTCVIKTDIVNTSTIIFQTADLTDTLQDDLLQDNLLEIRVYN